MNLHQLARDRFLSLLIHRAAGDTRTGDQLRKEAAKQIVREARIAANYNRGAQTELATTSAFETLCKRLWQIVTNRRQYDELMKRRKPSSAERRGTVVPTILDAPIEVVDEPPNRSSTTDLKDNVVTFPIVSGIGTANLIPDQEFASRFHDQTTSNWRQSIQQNESIAKLRAQRSAQHRNSSKYVG
jgi:hypothetical protein